METFVVTLVFLLSSIIAMAVGVILSNRELKGSCGGLNRVIGEDCMFCGKKEECDALGKNQCQENEKCDTIKPTILDTLSNL